MNTPKNESGAAGVTATPRPDVSAGEVKHPADKVPPEEEVVKILKEVEGWPLFKQRLFFEKVMESLKSRPELFESVFGDLAREVVRDELRKMKQG